MIIPKENPNARTILQSKHHQPASECLLETPPFGKFARFPPSMSLLTYLNSTYDANSFAQQAISHVCLRDGPGSETPNMPTTDCLRMRSQVFFPSCWDGVNLDSADHQSHVGVSPLFRQGELLTSQ